MKILDLPNLRQTYNYDCGATALLSILVYYGIESRADKVIKAAGTSENGTSIQGIVAVANKQGLKTDSRKMTINDIKEYINNNIPVIIVLQAWTDKKKVNWEKNWVDGHYVVAIGYTKDKMLFEDPSSFKRTYLKYDELEKRWHDVAEDGRKYFHHGIAIFGKKPQIYKNKVEHMD